MKALPAFRASRMSVALLELENTQVVGIPILWYRV